MIYDEVRSDRIKMNLPKINLTPKCHPEHIRQAQCKLRRGIYRTVRHPERFFCHPERFFCHPERSRGIYLICLITLICLISLIPYFIAPAALAQTPTPAPMIFGTDSSGFFIKEKGGDVKLRINTAGYLDAPILGGAGSGGGGNLIYNPGFEYPSSGTTSGGSFQVYNWWKDYHYQGNRGTTSTSSDTAIVREGQKSFSVALASTADGTAIASDPFSIIGNTIYTVSVDVKGATSMTTGLYVRVFYFAADEEQYNSSIFPGPALIDAPAFTFVPIGTPNTGYANTNWNTLSADITTPTTNDCKKVSGVGTLPCTKARVVLYHWGIVGTRYFDNVVFKEKTVGATVPASSVTSGTFATGNFAFTGNLGIGTTSPAAKLDIAGTTSFIKNTSGDLSIKTAGNLLVTNSAGTTEYMRVTSGGLVGIGTTGPGAKLEVNGAIQMTADANGELNLGRYGAAFPNAYIDANAGASANAGMIFRTTNNGTTEQQRMIITYDGNVGIGTTGPVGLLNINATSAAVPATSGTTQSAGHRIRLSTTSGSGILDIGAAGGTGMWLQSTDNTDLATNYPLLLNPNGGNVGIGTTGPSQKLDVNGNIALSSSINKAGLSANAVGLARLGINTLSLLGEDDNTKQGGFISFDSRSSQRVVAIWTKQPNSSTETEVVSITNAGNVGIGTTGPGAPLEVAKNGSHFAPLLILRDTNTSTVGQGLVFNTAWSNAAARNWALQINSVANSDFAIMQSNALGGDPLNTGTARLYINSSGNVGIGTTAPAALLQIGAAQAGAGVPTYRGDLIVNRGALSTTTAGGIEFLPDANANGYGWRQGVMLNGAASGYDYIFMSRRNSASWTERIRFDDTGNVGIGTTGPGVKLDSVGAIRNSAPSQGYLELSGLLPGYADNTYPTLKTSGANLYISVSGLYSAYVNSAGTWTALSDRNKKENFVDLNPQDILTKIDQLPMYQWNFKAEDPSIKHIAPVAQDFYALFGLNGTNDKMISNIDPSGVALVGVKALSNKLSVLEKGLMVDATSGNVGIGTTSPQGKLDVAGTAYVTSGAWSGSDVRWKKNIVPLKDSLDKVLKLQGVSFLWNKEAYPDKGFTEGQQIGLVAQNVEKVVPEVVSTGTDSYKSLSYEKLTAVLIEAIKELKAENEQLKSRVSALETK